MCVRSARLVKTEESVRISLSQTSLADKQKVNRVGGFDAKRKEIQIKDAVALISPVVRKIDRGATQQRGLFSRPQLQLYCL